MILTGQIKQLQLFWVDKRNPDKVIMSKKIEFSFMISDFYSTHDRARAIWSYICGQGLPFPEYNKGKLGLS